MLDSPFSVAHHSDTLDRPSRVQDAQRFVVIMDCNLIKVDKKLILVHTDSENLRLLCDVLRMGPEIFEKFDANLSSLRN